MYLHDGVTASAESVTRTRSTARRRRIPAVDRATLESALLAAGVDPAAINGDRDVGTLTPQVTLITTGQIVIGKFLAAWITALGFLAVSVPFLIYSTLLGGLSGAAIVVSILVLAVAALSIGTLIASALGGLAVQSE